MDRTDSGNSLHHGLPFLSFVGLVWLQACSEQPGEAPGSPSWEGAKGPQAEPAESWGRWEEPRGVAPPSVHTAARVSGLRRVEARQTNRTHTLAASQMWVEQQAEELVRAGPTDRPGCWSVAPPLLAGAQGPGSGPQRGDRYRGGLRAGEQYLSQPQTGWGRCRVCRPPLLAGTGPAGNLAAEGRRKTLECENQLHLRGSIAGHRSQGFLRPGAVPGEASRRKAPQVCSEGRRVRPSRCRPPYLPGLPLSRAGLKGTGTWDSQGDAWQKGCRGAPPSRALGHSASWTPPAPPPGPWQCRGWPEGSTSAWRCSRDPLFPQLAGLTRHRVVP